MAGTEWVYSAIADVRYELRQLRKNPSLVVTVAVSLSIGMGVNTAIFSLVDAAILRPLPVKDPAALRIVEWTSNGFPLGDQNVTGDFEEISRDRIRGSSIGANLHRRLAQEQTAFDALIGISDFAPVAVAVDAFPAEQVGLQYTSSNFFQGLGTLPTIGRPFRNEDDRIGREPLVIVSHRFWVRQLGGRADVLDRDIRINNVAARIVGVAPPRFFGLRVGEWIDIYAPLAARVAFQPSSGDGRPRGEDDREWWVRQVGRLKPGVSEEAA